MTDPVPNPTPTPAVPPKPAVERADQDKKMLDRIVGSAQALATSQADSEIMTALAPRGYEAAKFTEGVGLQQVALNAFSIRQTAMKAQAQATAIRNGADSAAREMYSEFRYNAKKLFPAAADRTALNLNGNVFKDTQQFIGQARMSYLAAQSAAYAATFAANGYPAAYLTAALKSCDDLKAADETQNAAIGAATKATADRDAAFKALDNWMKVYERIAGSALKQRPDLAKKINVVVK
jgi:hypothetical protein